MKVLAFGEILWDIIDGEKHLGGAPLNFAAHTVQGGGSAGMVSALGADELGTEALKKVNQFAVNTALIQTIQGKATGTVLVTTIDGQPDYEIGTNVAYDFIEVTELNDQQLQKYDVFYFGSLIQRTEKSQQALFHILNNYTFGLVFYDVNLRKDCYSKSIIEKSLGYCHILKMNDDEVRTISQMICNREFSFELLCNELKNKYPQINIIIMTSGAKGSSIFENGKIHSVKSNTVKVMNTVGAGDAYSATFLRAYYESKNSLKSAELASKVGGFVAAKVEAIPEYTKEIELYFL